MQRLRKVKLTITCNTTNNTVGTGSTPALSGYLRGIKIKSPTTVDSSATLTTVIKDDDTDTITIASGFAGQAANGTVTQFADTANNPLERPVAGLLTVTCTLSATQSTTRDVTVFLYVDSAI